MKKYVYEYLLNTPLGEVSVVKGKRFELVIEAVNEALDGNEKVIDALVGRSEFLDLLHIVEVLKKTGGRIEIVSVSPVIPSEELLEEYPLAHQNHQS